MNDKSRFKLNITNAQRNDRWRVFGRKKPLNLSNLLNYFKSYFINYSFSKFIFIIKDKFFLANALF